MGAVTRVPQRGQRGFTLIELLTTLLVIAVLLVMTGTAKESSSRWMIGSGSIVAP